jgi:NADH-quinone oxidoreductase subunit G
MDALGSAIRVDSRGPRCCACCRGSTRTINEEWISDKTRYAVDGLSRQRLDRPYIREGGKLRPRLGRGAGRRRRRS